MTIMTPYIPHPNYSPHPIKSPQPPIKSISYLPPPPKKVHRSLCVFGEAGGDDFEHFFWFFDAFFLGVVFRGLEEGAAFFGVEAEELAETALGAG